MIGFVFLVKLLQGPHLHLFPNKDSTKCAAGSFCKKTGALLHRQWHPKETQCSQLLQSRPARLFTSPPQQILEHCARCLYVLLRLEICQQNLSFYLCPNSSERTTPLCNLDCCNCVGGSYPIYIREVVQKKIYFLREAIN